MSGHGSTLCSPTVEKLLCRSPISQRSHVGNLRQTLKGKGRKSEGGNRRCLPSCAPARRQRTPCRGSAKNFPPVRGEHAYAVRVPRSAGAEKPPARFAFPRLPLYHENEKGTAHAVPLPFCGYVSRSAAAVAAITAAAAGIITTGTAGTAAAAALTAAYPDQDDQDDDPPPGIFAPEAVRRTHTVISSYQRFHYILW